MVRLAIVKSRWWFDITRVISGASKSQVQMFLDKRRVGNPDIFGAWWAILNDVPVDYYPADWEKYGKSAGPIRNSEMANHADALILIWDGSSRGSRDMKMKAKGLKRYEEIVRFD